MCLYSCHLFDHIQFTFIMAQTFQAPMQYCSLQHVTLLSPPDIITTGCHFHFGSATSFLPELLVIALQSSPVAYRIPCDLRAHVLVSHLLASHTVELRILTERTLEWLFSPPLDFFVRFFVRTLNYNLSLLDSPPPRVS